MTRAPVQGPREPGRPRDDGAVFDGWVDEHASGLYRFAYRLCGDPGGAEDLVQETYHEAWKHRGPLREVRDARAWLFLALRRRYAKLRRFEQRHPWLVGVDLDRAEAVAEPDRGLERVESADALQSALDSMSDLFKVPLLMLFVQGLSCAQVAERLDVPLGTVLSRIHRAKQHVRAALLRQEGRGAAATGAGGIDAGSTDQRRRLRIGGVP